PHAMHGPRPASFLKMGRVLGMPVPGRQHRPAPLGKKPGVLVQDGNHSIPFLHGQSPARAKVILHVHDDEGPLRRSSLVSSASRRALLIRRLPLLHAPSLLSLSFNKLPSTPREITFLFLCFHDSLLLNTSVRRSGGLSPLAGF